MSFGVRVLGCSDNYYFLKVYNPFGIFLKILSLCSMENFGLGFEFVGFKLNSIKYGSKILYPAISFKNESSLIINKKLL